MLSYTSYRIAVFLSMYSMRKSMSVTTKKLIKVPFQFYKEITQKTISMFPKVIVYFQKNFTRVNKLVYQNHCVWYTCRDSARNGVGRNEHLTRVKFPQKYTVLIRLEMGQVERVSFTRVKFPQKYMVFIRLERGQVEMKILPA